MTGKRFTFEKNTGLKNDEVFVVIDNNTDEVFSLENERESNSLVIRMNELAEENEQLLKENKRLYEDNIRVKQLITEAYNTERTQIGRNTLKQLLEQI